MGRFCILCVSRRGTPKWGSLSNRGSTEVPESRGPEMPSEKTCGVVLFLIQLDDTHEGNQRCLSETVWILVDDAREQAG